MPQSSKNENVNTNIHNELRNMFLESDLKIIIIDNIFGIYLL